MKVRVMLVSLTLGLAVGAAILHIEMTKRRMEERFGPTPGLALVFHADEGDAVCERVESFAPKAHYNWRGEVWQEESLRWEDIRIEARLVPHEPISVPHDKIDNVQIGDIVCGLPKGRALVWVYNPTGEELSSSSAYS